MWHCEVSQSVDNSYLGAPSTSRKAHVSQAGASMCKLQAWLQIETVVCASNLCRFAMCGLLASMQLRCELHCLRAGCCAMAGIVLWCIIMTVLEVWAALAPILHWLASLSRRLAAVFREHQVRIMAHSAEISHILSSHTQVSPPFLLTSPFASPC